MVGIGVVDDLKGLSAPVKLAGQILAATTMTLGGVQVLFFWPAGLRPARRGRHQPRPRARGAVHRPAGDRLRQRRQPGRRPRRPGRRPGRHRRHGLLRLQLPHRRHRPDRPGLAGPAVQRPALRRLHRVPAPQLQPGPHLHGRHRLHAARHPGRRHHHRHRPHHPAPGRRPVRPADPGGHPAGPGPPVPRHLPGRRPPHALAPAS